MTPLAARNAPALNERVQSKSVTGHTTCSPGLATRIICERLGKQIRVWLAVTA